MSPQDIEEAVRRRPFAPFRITLTEGSTYDVRHPELCMVGRRAVVVGVLRPVVPASGSTTRRRSISSISSSWNRWT